MTTKTAPFPFDEETIKGFIEVAKKYRAMDGRCKGLELLEHDIPRFCPHPAGCCWEPIDE